MRTPEGWHKAWLKNAALFQNDAITKNTRPQRLGAPLRYGPRHYMSAYAASLRSVAPGSISFFYATRGSAASPLHRLPKGWRPYRGFKFGFAIARKLIFNFRFIELR